MTGDSKPKKPRNKTDKRKNKAKPKNNKYKKDVNKNLLVTLQNPRFENLKFKGGLGISTNGTTQYSYAMAFRMDSIYDPDYSNYTKNKTVQGYSLLNTLYKYYKVYGFEAKITIQNMSSTTARFCVAGADSNAWVNDYTTVRYGSDIAGRAGVKSVIVGPTGTTAGMKTITYRCRPCDVVGLSKQSWAADQSTGAPFGSNPSPTIGVTPMFVISISNLLDTISSVSAYVSIELSYATRLSDPVELTDA